MKKRHSDKYPQIVAINNIMVTSPQKYKIDIRK